MQSMRNGCCTTRNILRKCHLLHALSSKHTAEVARELLMIFPEFGLPKVLQSSNGREIIVEVSCELASLWPELVLVNSRTRHPQSHGSIERANGDKKSKLIANGCLKWTLGIKFVQYSDR